MGTKRIVIGTNGSIKELESNVYIPDRSGLETAAAYQSRILRYLNQAYAAQGWKEPARSHSAIISENAATLAKSKSAEMSLQRQFSRLQRRATKSLHVLKKKFPLK